MLVSAAGGYTANAIIIIAIDLLGVVVGILVLINTLGVLKSFTGALRKSFGCILYGILSQVLALAYTLIFIRFKIYPVPAGIDIHHFLMIVGIIFFAAAAYHLTKMMQELKKNKTRK